MAKGIYIVAESACLIPGSGAYQHIQVGLEELSKSFDIEILQTCPNPQVKVARKVDYKAYPSESPFRFIKRQLNGFKLLIKNHLRFCSYLRRIKKTNPDFIYERAAYLNYNGLLAAKLLRKPHFYEVNGILWLDNNKFHSNIFNSIARVLESWAYRKSNFAFFVGGLSKYFDVNQRNYLTVQNGIETAFVNRFSLVEKTLPDAFLEVVFIGHRMPHHKVELLCESSFLIKNNRRVRFHLVGKNLEEVADQFSSNVEVVIHGLLTHDEIAQLLQQCHVGVVPFVKDYYSNVKAFMYGAAKLLVMLPRFGNFEHVFTEDEVLSIRNEDSIHIALRLDEVINNPSMIHCKGKKIYKKVSEYYTWQSIFSAKAQCISDFLAKKKGTHSPLLHGTGGERSKDI